MSDQNAQTEPKTEPQVSTNGNLGVNIEQQANNAAGSTAEDTLGEYKALLEQMKAQNQALIEQNKSLQNQFGILIRNGAHVGRHGDSTSVSDSGTNDALHSMQDSGQSEPQEPYVSLAELGSQLGKRDYQSHNTKKE
jgi:hypothetical protein